MVKYLLPLSSESRWSDMLAVFIATDPHPMCALIDAEIAESSSVDVRREVVVDPKNKLDLLVEIDAKPLAVIECKVLNALSAEQLRRYQEAVPAASSYLVILPQRLATGCAPTPWKPLAWESILTAYTASTDQWVAETATAWLEHLDASVPTLGPDTRWDDLRLNEDFVIEMRARMVWLHDHLQPPLPLTHDLIESAAGVSWVVRLFAECPTPGYQIMMEVEENLSVREFPRFFRADGLQPRGPSVRLCLLRRGLTTSAGFNWDHLLALWPLMAAARTDWITNAAQPKASHDRAGYKAMVAKGGPAHLGIGFGEAQAKRYGVCMFGARFQLPSTIRLGEVAATLEDLYPLVKQMAAVQPRAVT